MALPCPLITSAPTPLFSVLLSASRLPTSQGQVCVFFICFPSMNLRAWSPESSGGCLLTGEAETGESICSSDSRRSCWHGASFQEEHLARQSSCSVRPARPPAHRAGLREGLVSAWKMRSLRSLPAPPEPRAHSLFNEMLLSNVFTGNWCGGFFLSPLFLPGPWHGCSCHRSGLEARFRVGKQACH